jgi:hypothetical protein
MGERVGFFSLHPLLMISQAEGKGQFPAKKHPVGLVVLDGLRASG